jgi:hypothetical protein
MRCEYPKISIMTEKMLECWWKVNISVLVVCSVKLKHQVGRLR